MNDTIDNAIKGWDRLFVPAMAKFRHVPSDVPPALEKRNLSIRDKTSWDELLAVLEKCQEIHKGYDLGKNGVTFTRYRHRLTNSVCKFASQYVTVIPDGPVSSPIRQLLVVIFKAGVTASKVRSTVESETSGIDDIVKKVGCCFLLYPNDSFAYDQAVSCAVSVFCAVESVCAFLVTNSLQRAKSALLAGDEYQSNLLQSLAAIHKSYRELLERVDILGKFETRNMKATVDTLRDEIKSQNQTILQLLREAQVGRQESLSQQQNQQPLCQQSQPLSYQQQHKIYEPATCSLTPPSTPISPSYTQSSQSQYAYPPLGYTQEAYAIQFYNPMPVYQLPLSTAPITTPTTTTKSHIMHAFSYSNMPLADIESDIARVKRYDVPSAEVSRAMNLLREKRVRHWLSQPVSLALLIYDDSLDSILPICGISRFSTVLTDAVSAAPGYISLSFFCGLHHGPGESAALSIIRGLLAQLLSISNIFDCIATYEIGLTELMALSLDAHLQLFQVILSKLPMDSAIVIILDSVFFYERDDSGHDLARVLPFLLDLTHGSSPRLVKVLVTSPKRPRHLCTVFSKDYIVSMSQLKDMDLDITEKGTMHRLGRQGYMYY